MGLFDWIGESIGNAFSALAEFIGDAMSTVFESTLGNLFVFGDKLLKQMLIEVKGSDTEINSNATALSKLLETEFIDDANKAINTALDYEGTLDPGEATRVLRALYGPIDEHMISGVIFALITEIVSLGQVEGVQQLLAMEDKMKGFSDLASTYRRMQNEVGLFQPYRKELNARYQNIIPGPTDLIRMQLREVFHPDFRAELLEPPPSATFITAMEEQGFNKYWSDSYWGAHWVLPSMGDLDEMLHRRFISPEDWEIMVRRNDYLPAWIPNRKKIIYKPYTRVDTRRMWDLRSLSEQEVYENYQDLGYDEEHAEKMTIWTKLYVLAVEIRARYSKGWISAEDVKSEIIAAGMPPARAEIWVQKIVRAESETRTEVERDLTKAEIVKGVKKGFISVSEGIELLVDMGYDEAEAEYIIVINVEAIGGSPTTYSEFRNIVNKRRKSLGLSVIELPEGIKEIEDQIRELEDLRQEGIKAEEREKFFTELDKTLDPLKERYLTLKGTGTGSDKTTEAPTSKKNKT